MDYKIWMKYAHELRGNKTKKGDVKRTCFFHDLGCSDFELDIFDNFYALQYGPVEMDIYRAMSDVGQFSILKFNNRIFK